MDDGFTIWWWLSVGALVVGFTFGTVIGYALADDNWRRETVARDLAMHCPTDGAWAWKGECGK